MEIQEILIIKERVKKDIVFWERLFFFERKMIACS